MNLNKINIMPISDPMSLRHFIGHFTQINLMKLRFLCNQNVNLEKINGLLSAKVNSDQLIVEVNSF